MSLVAFAWSAQDTQAERVHVTALGDLPPGKMPFAVISGVAVPPKLIRASAPVYSLPRIGGRENGFATISCTVDVTGRTHGFRVVKSSRPYFARDAMAALEKWIFKPATKNGRPVPCVIEVPFLFHLHP